MTISDGARYAGIPLAGLDGSNPLGFLAALGTLRVLDLANDDPFRPPRMWWVRTATCWHPTVLAFYRGTVLSDRAAFLEHLANSLALHCNDSPFRWADDTTVEPAKFRAFAREAAESASRSKRRLADFAGAFASEVLTGRDGKVQDTALRTISAVGNQNFLRSMRQLVKLTEQKHLRAALFERWAYVDDRPSMRWDPVDDRRHALRWRKPKHDKIRTVRGANRLAIEALPLMPTAPRGSRLETTGFRNVTWTWPIWERPADVRLIRSLLTHPALQRRHPEGPDMLTLREMGIVEAFRSRRINNGQYRNFTPAVPVSSPPRRRAGRR